MPTFENPTDKELKDTLEEAEGLAVGDDIEVRLGKDPRTADGAPSKTEEE